MARRDGAAVLNDLTRVARGPKGWLKKPKLLLDLFTEAGGTRTKGIPPALMAAVEVIEKQLPHVPVHQRTTVEAGLRAALSGLARGSKKAQAFVLERLPTDHGALPASYVLFATSPSLAYDRLAPSFVANEQLLPHPLLGHALRLLQYGQRALKPAAGAPKDPGWLAAEPRWIDVCMKLVAMLHTQRDLAWSTLPFNAIDVLALAGTPDADRALIDLVGVVSVDTAWQAWSKVSHHRDGLAEALREERKRLIEAHGPPVGDPYDPDGHPVFVLDHLLEGL